MECEFCNHKFSNKSSLRSHQRHAKYCLKLRGKEEYNFECSGCGKKYTSKENLQIHETSCISINSNTFKSIIESKNIEIKELKAHIKELEKQIQEIALKAVSRPTTTKTHKCIYSEYEASDNEAFDRECSAFDDRTYKEGC